jgi:hypothetical protein
LKSNFILLTLVLFSPILILLKKGIAAGDTEMDNPPDQLPGWIAVLDAGDMQFLLRFLLSSGSLKALAGEYEVSYPTVRARLDRLIEKVRAAEDPRVRDPLDRRLRVLVADGKLDPSTARELLELHRNGTKRRTPS